MNAPATISEADERALLDSIDRWLERKVAPVAARYEQADEYPARTRAGHVRDGPVRGPDRAGVRRPRPVRRPTYSRIVARISEEWMSLTGFFNSHLMMALIVQKFGTAAQKDHWLPRFATGELRGGLALTEPDAGTDLQGIRTTARRDGDDYSRQRLEAVDHQRHRGRRPGPAGEDRSRTPSRATAA